MDVTAPVQPIRPTIKAPASARGAWTPHPPKSNIGDRVEELIERGADRLPQGLRDAVFGVVTKINDYVFRSRPAGAPVDTESGSWTFSAIGDYGAATRAQTDVARNIAKSKPDLIVTTGDNVYYRGTEAEWQKKWDPPQYFGELRKQFPVYPSLGNHDVGVEPTAYFKRFPELGGARYYSYDHKSVHFVALNTTEPISPGSDQHRWLERDLAASKADFKVLYFHHPMLSGAERSKASKVHDYLGPVLAKYGVDLVLTGHEHWYERSYPVNGHGTTHVLTGGGGNTLYPFFFRQNGWSAHRDVNYGHVNVEVQRDALVGRYMLRDGTIGDTFVIPKAIRQASEGVAALATQPDGAGAAAATQVPPVLATV